MWIDGEDLTYGRTLCFVCLGAKRLFAFRVVLSARQTAMQTAVGSDRRRNKFVTHCVFVTICKKYIQVHAIHDVRVALQAVETFVEMAADHTQHAQLPRRGHRTRPNPCQMTAAWLPPLQLAGAALAAMKIATVAPSQRLSRILPCDDSTVTTASPPSSALL